MRAHVPPPEVLAKYLRPELMPSRGVQAFSSPEAYRIRAPDRSAGCFLAQYSFAHCLPSDLLASKGLFGTLVCQGELTRFFAACEVSSMHGTVLPTLCAKERRLSMRLLGNCIAVPHAAVALLKGCQAKGHLLHVSTQEVVKQCEKMRLHARNSILLPCGADWILCHASQALQVLQQTGPHMGMQVPPSLPDMLQSLQMSHEGSTYEVWMSPAVEWRRGVQAMGFPRQVADSLRVEVFQSVAVVAVPFAPLLPGTEDERRHVANLDLMLVTSASRTAILPRQSCSHLAQLTVLATEFLDPCDRPRFLAHTSGCRVPSLDLLPPLTLLLPEPKEPEVFCPSLVSSLNSACECHMESVPVCVQVPARLAVDVWLGWPLDHLEVLGWTTTFVPALPDGTADMVARLSPTPNKVAIATDGLRKLFLQFLLAARLQRVQQQPCPCLMTPVQVQLVTCEVWSGLLPDDFRIELLTMWWHELATMFGVEPRSHVFSGSQLLPPSVTPAEVDVSGGRTDGSHQLLVLSLCPYLPDEGQLLPLPPGAVVATYARAPGTSSRHVQRSCPLMPGPLKPTLCDLQVLLPFYATARVGEASHPGPPQPTGTKEETRQWAMTKLATLCLSQGVDLAVTSTFVNALVDKVGSPKLVALLNETPELARWEAVNDLARSHDVAVPPARDGHARGYAGKKGSPACQTTATPVASCRRPA